MSPITCRTGQSRERVDNLVFLSRHLGDFGLLVSAHNAVGMDDHGSATFNRFVENIRPVDGESLLEVVDPRSRYWAVAG
jgi:hypothetical protein